MRTITHIIVHCSANKAGSALRMADIDRIHRTQNGWNGCGYHYVIPTDGTIECGRPEQLPGAHCRGHNSRSIGVCYVGGLDASGRPADTRTVAQRLALHCLLSALKRLYPGVVIRGHRDFAAKACPCFDATSEYAAL